MRVLVVVDMQNDFVSGALGTSGYGDRAPGGGAGPGGA